MSGCSWFDGEPEPPPPDPLEPLLAGTRRLKGRYQDALATHPELTDRLQPLHQTHSAHEDALVQLIGRPELASTGGSGPDTPGTGNASPGGPGPDRSDGDATDPQELLTELRRAEQEAQAEAAQACLSAPPERTALLGSITAARATHAEVLV